MHYYKEIYLFVHKCIFQLSLGYFTAIVPKNHHDLWFKSDRQCVSFAVVKQTVPINYLFAVTDNTASFVALSRPICNRLDMILISTVMIVLSTFGQESSSYAQSVTISLVSYLDLKLFFHFYFLFACYLGPSWHYLLKS